ncbi:MAG TPA: hypothetical protein VKP30_19220, partial [Polyangiaceae bacterium]|nr:hypothetical protein [Polyangiaceae bacterium]
MLTSQLRQAWRQCILPQLAVSIRASPSLPSSPPARSACVNSVDRANLSAPWSCRREYGFGEDRAAAAALVCRALFFRRTASARTSELGQDQFNLWVKNGPAEGEKEPRGTEIGQYGRLQPDLWGAMFDLYEYNLRDELGENSDGVATLRQGLTWVDGDKKTVGFGEKHPTTENALDGMRSQADRRVEVLMFDAGEEPDLAATNGEDIYDGVTFERTTLEPMTTARREPVVVALRDTAGQPIAGAGVELSMGDAVYATGITNSLGECQLKAEELPEVVLRTTHIDESKFSTAELVEQPYYFADEFAEGVLLPFGHHIVVTLSLCHFSLTLDDTTLLSEPQIATLVSAD